MMNALIDKALDKYEKCISDNLWPRLQRNVIVKLSPDMHMERTTLKTRTMAQILTAKRVGRRFSIFIVL